jgi:DNA-binding NtrC family response regulator
MHILVVDDDQVVLESCRRILETEGITSTLATNVRDALTTLENETFDLILVDIKMPEEDGLSLIHQVKENDVRIPILVMSGYPTSETIDTSITEGARDFIPKPFTPDELLDTIKKITGGARGTEKNPDH